jgi:hypothetical protein
MCKFSLSFLGPRTAARANVVPILKAFPKAMFIEKDEGLFEVTADSGFDQQVLGHGHWRAIEIPA